MDNSWFLASMDLKNENDNNFYDFGQNFTFAPAVGTFTRNLTSKLRENWKYQKSQKVYMGQCSKH